MRLKGWFLVSARSWIAVNAVNNPTPPKIKKYDNYKLKKINHHARRRLLWAFADGASD